MKKLERGNLYDFSGLTANSQQEFFQTLLETPAIRLERIISAGHVTPPGQWYDQAWDEWVLLLSGAAQLNVEGKPKWLHMQPGDYVFLPAHRRHRVEWTDMSQKTVWLALHCVGQ